MSKNKKRFISSLLVLTPLFILSIQAPVLFYILKNYMQYKYYSPFLICFLIGLIFIIISIIELFFFALFCGKGTCRLLILFINIYLQ